MVSEIVLTVSPRTIEDVYKSVRGKKRHLGLFKCYLNANFTSDVGFAFIRAKPSRGVRARISGDRRDIPVPLINCVIVNQGRLHLDTTHEPMFLICTIVDIELDRRSFRCYVAVRGEREDTSSAGPGLSKKSTHKDTSCFQTGLWADVRPSNPFEGVLVPDALGTESDDLGDEELDTGDWRRVSVGVS